MQTCGGCGLAGIPEDTRNVADHFKGWHDGCIVLDLDSRRNDLIIVTENVNYDFHKGNILRTAEGFNLKEFWIVGHKKWDRRPAVGAYNRLIPQYAPSLSEMCIPEGYSVVTLDNIPGAKPLGSFSWPRKTVLIVGEEQRGVSQDAIDMADHVVYIEMAGAVRSFSVSTAAGIAIYDFISYTTHKEF